MKINQALNLINTHMNALNTHQLFTISAVNAYTGHDSGFFQLHLRSFLSILMTL
jgi:hypothetical protein